jgi:hypothetical protein
VANWQNSSNSQILNYTQLSLCISLFSAYKFWLVIPTYSGFPDEWDHQRRGPILLSLSDPNHEPIVQPSPGIHITVPGCYSPRTVGLLDPPKSHLFLTMAGVLRFPVRPIHPLQSKKVQKRAKTRLGGYRRK